LAATTLQNLLSGLLSLQKSEMQDVSPRIAYLPTNILSFFEEKKLFFCPTKIGVKFLLVQKLDIIRPQWWCSTINVTLREMGIPLTILLDHNGPQ
jgi:hypothetical protein